MCVALAAFSCVAVVNGKSSTELEENKTQAAADYSDGVVLNKDFKNFQNYITLEEGEYNETKYTEIGNLKIIPDDIYNDNENFYIGDKEGLLIFRDNVYYRMIEYTVTIGKHETTAYKHGHRYFTGKTIYLIDDIDFEDEVFEVVRTTFEGTFDGNFKTISNFQMYDPNYLSIGFFKEISNATIRNLRLKDFEFADFDGTNNLYCEAGGIVKTGEDSIIENCVIENFNAEFKYHKKYEKVAAIIGYAKSVQIRDCYVQNFSENGKNKEAKNNHIGPYSAYFEGSNIIENCVVNNYNNFYYGLADEADVVKDTFVKWKSEDWDNCGMWNYNSSKNEIKHVNLPAPDRFLKYDSDYWHIPPTTEFNQGVPYPDVYIERGNKYKFATDGNGKVNDVEFVELDLPSVNPDGTKPSFSVGGITTDTIAIYGNSINATPKPGYKFASWTKSADGKTFTANFEMYSIDVKFNPITITYGGKSYTVNPVVVNVSPIEELKNGMAGSLCLPKGSFNISYYLANNKIEFLCSDDFWMVTYDLQSADGANIWNSLYTLKTIKINNVDVKGTMVLPTNASGYIEVNEYGMFHNSQIYLDDILGAIKCDLDKVVQDGGLSFSIELELKRYNLDVK